MSTPHDCFREALTRTPEIAIEKLTGCDSFSDREVAVFVTSIVGHNRRSGRGCSAEDYRLDAICKPLLAGDPVSADQCEFLRSWAAESIRVMQHRSLTHRRASFIESCRSHRVGWMDELDTFFPQLAPNAAPQPLH